MGAFVAMLESKLPLQKEKEALKRRPLDECKDKIKQLGLLVV